MTRQEVFNKVAKHLLKQGEPALGAMGCRYLTDDGKKCAVGCLIPKRLYSVRMEGMAANHSVVSSVLTRVFKHKISAKMDSLLGSLQGVHDAHPAYRWPEEMVRVAKLHGLRSTVVARHSVKKACGK